MHVANHCVEHRVVLALVFVVLPRDPADAATREQDRRGDQHPEPASCANHRHGKKIDAAILELEDRGVVRLRGCGEGYSQRLKPWRGVVGAGVPAGVAVWRAASRR
jgi:hypothetical protein